MSEYVFNLVDANKRNFQAKFNDIIFDYVGYRNHLSENLCIKILNSIKEKSGKKIAIIFGNCQTEKLQNFLLNNYFFAKKYFIIKLPMVCNYGNDKLLSCFQENFWSLCDLFISQRISNDNRFNPVLATQKIPLLLPEYAKIIWVPNVYFDGYFPQNSKNFCEVDTYRFRNGGLFPHGDKFVDAFLDGGARQDAIFWNLSNISRRKILFQRKKF